MKEEGMFEKTVTLIAPCRNEEAYIDAFIQSFLEQDCSPEFYDLVIVDGESDDRTPEKIRSYAGKYEQVHLLNNPDRFVSHALNLGIRHSSSKYIFILGIHAKYPGNYISELTADIESNAADVVGGMLKTLPADNSGRSVAIASAVSHPIGVGDSHFRIGAEKPMEVDTVPFGCYRHSVFDEVGLFDTDLIRNQDDEFNARMRKHGKKVVLIPSVVTEYYARDRYAKLWKMFYQYGLFKPLASKKIGKIYTVRQFIPPAFVLGVLLGLPISIILNAEPVYLSLIGLYILIILLTGSTLAIRQKSVNKLSFAALLSIAFVIIHFAYGIGSLAGSFLAYVLRRSRIRISKPNR